MYIAIAMSVINLTLRIAIDIITTHIDIANFLL